MTTFMRSQTFAAFRALAVFTLILGIGYPLVVWGVGQLVFNDKANGSLISQDGKDIGSSLIGQAYVDAEGNPLPQWFQGRPSAASYDGLASGASNQGPDNPELAQAVEERRQAIAAFDGVNPEDVPIDAVTASGSGLDPHISPAYARQQVNRVAGERGLEPAAVRALVDEHTEGRMFGFLGEPTVNVLELNLAVASLR